MSRFNAFYCFTIVMMIFLAGNMSCGKSIGNAQAFSPNKPPVLDISSIILTDTSGNSFNQSAIILGLKVRCAVKAYDPENKSLRYTFNSSYGSTSNQTQSDTGCSVDFVVERVGTGEPILLNLVISDSKEASTAVSIDIGTGQIGAVLTVNEPANSYIKNDGTTSFTFKASGSGWFQVLESSSDISDPEAAMSVLLKYAAADELVTITLAGASSLASGDLKTLRLSSGDGLKKIWVLFRDQNNYYTSGTTSTTVDTSSPSILSVSPASGTIVNVPSETVTVVFSEKVDPSTLASALLISGGYYDAVTLNSYDASTCTALFTLSGLRYNSRYSAAVSGVKDYAGNAVPDYSVILYTPDTALLTRTAATATGDSDFYAIASDGNGNIFCAGKLVGDTGTNCDFGNNVTALVQYSGGNIILAKYNRTGTAQWAATVLNEEGESAFNAVSTDASGNVYVSGFISGVTQLSDAVSLPGLISRSCIIAKYGSSGIPLWAKSVESGNAITEFSSVATDNSGNIITSGYLTGNTSDNFGSNVTVSGSAVSANNGLVVKYSSGGTALWAKSTSSGSAATEFKSIAVDGSGNIYAAGYLTGNGSFGFGSGVTVSGAYSGGKNLLIVKYAGDGTALWAKSVPTGASSSEFRSVSVDSAGNVYAAGNISGSGAFILGNSVSVVGTYASGVNSLVVKYGADGTVLWASSVTAGAGLSEFCSVKADTTGNIYTAGYISGGGKYGFGNNIMNTGVYASGTSLVIVRYNSAGSAQWSVSPVSGSSASILYSVTADSTGIFAAGSLTGTGSFSFIKDVSVSGISSSRNPLLLGF